MPIVKKDVSAKLVFEEVHLESTMGRSLLVTEIAVLVPRTHRKEHYTSWAKIVHLESLQSKDRRRLQLKVSRD